jgi:hypothetical protein
VASIQQTLAITNKEQPEVQFNEQQLGVFLGRETKFWFSFAVIEVLVA